MIHRSLFLAFVMTWFGLSAVSAQQPQGAPASDQPFAAGAPLKMTPNARTYGGFRWAESISYDAKRDLYVVPSAGMGQQVVPNDGYVSLINPDGTVHTLKWIGVNRNGLTLNHPFGSHIVNDRLYLADIVIPMNDWNAITFVEIGGGR